MKLFTVVINEMLGKRNSYGYYAGEEFEVVEHTAISYKVVSPRDKAGWKIYHAHCRKVEQ